MKESLAARQAALLKQNAELNERVEAIEQRRQQQQQSVNAASAHDLRQVTLSKLAAADDDEEKDPHVDDGTDDDGIAATAQRAPARSVGLAMDLSASIDSLGSALAPQEPLHAAQETTVSSSSNRPQSRQRSTKALERQGSADFEPSTNVTTSPANASRGNSRRVIANGSGGASAHAESSCGGADSPDGLGLEATVRYQKARLRVLQDEVDTANSHVKELQASHGVLKAQIDDLKTENSVLAKKHQQTQLLLDKQKELAAAQDAKQRILESQLAAAQARADEVQCSEKQASQQFRSKDVRLNRALEELEKVKAQLQDKRRAHDQDAAAKSELEQLARENKKLEKHKSELLVAFKKQMKLIDLLKRQRIHMEAAKMLSFTEEEFSKTLDLG